MELSAGAPIDIAALLQAPEPRMFDAALPADAALAAQWAAPFAAVLSAQQGVAESGQPLPQDGKLLPPEAPRTEAAPPQSPAQAATFPIPAARPSTPPLQDLTASANQALAARLATASDAVRAVPAESSVPTTPRMAGDAAAVSIDGTAPDGPEVAQLVARSSPPPDDGAAVRVAQPIPVVVPGAERPPGRALPAGSASNREHARSLGPILAPGDNVTPLPASEAARAAVGVAPPPPTDAALDLAAPRAAESADSPAVARTVDAAVPAAAPSPGIQLAAPAAADAVVAAQTSDAAGSQHARLSESVAGQVRYMIDHKLGEAKLTLNPPELGSLEIKISFIDDKAHVHMVAQQGQARDALEQGLPRLRELLTQGGMDLGGASVSGGGQERHGSDSRAPALSDALPFLEPEAGPVAPVAAARAGRVDLYA